MALLEQDDFIAHGEALTEADQTRFELKPMLVKQIEAWRQRKGLEPSQMPILDWGCGRGRTVFWLRDRGYDAYGIDIDERPVENGRELARARGLDADRVLSVIDAQSRTIHPDSFFEFSTSFQVFEHVQDVDAVARELARITRPGGGGFHVFPPAFWFFEGHLGMPFVHWLPDGAARDALIRTWVALGVESKPKDYEGLDATARAARYGDFLRERTHYWTAGRFRRAFENAGLHVEFRSIESPNVLRRLGSMADVPGVQPSLNWALSRFVSIHGLFTKPA